MIAAPLRNALLYGAVPLAGYWLRGSRLALCVFGVIYFGELFITQRTRGAETLDAELEKIRTEHHLPALAAIAMRDGKILGESAVGVRKLGSPEPVTTADQWHLGSCTKSMTATLAAILVEEGRLQWSATVGKTFPEWQKEMPAEWRGVTLEQLLTHRSGAPADPPAALWVEARKQIGTPTAQRLAFVHGLVVQPPEAPPGTKYLYSNQGYAIAGAMLERITGKPWEELIREKLFQPLGMKSAGFGAPATPGQVDEPWGHVREGDKLSPKAPGPGADNPPSIGPAGTVHCSLPDLARYAAMHAAGERDGWGVLKPETFARLHTPIGGQDYAMGWLAVPRDWAGGTALTHGGSNTMFYTDIWIAPKKDAVFISATNAGGDPAAEACDEAVAAVIRRFLQ